MNRRWFWKFTQKQSIKQTGGQRTCNRLVWTQWQVCEEVRKCKQCVNRQDRGLSLLTHSVYMHWMHTVVMVLWIIWSNAWKLSRWAKNRTLQQKTQWADDSQTDRIFVNWANTQRAAVVSFRAGGSKLKGTRRVLRISVRNGFIGHCLSACRSVRPFVRLLACVRQ